MPNFNYDKMETSDLANWADAEAHEFQLPVGLLEQRPHRSAIAFDSEFSRDRDDALSSSIDRSGRDILHVSIVDTGSFFEDLTAVSALANRRLYTKYNRDMVATPMIPRILSEDKLSFVHDKDRPAVTLHLPINNDGETGHLAFDRETVRATSLSPQEAELIHTDLDTPIDSLDRIAKKLYQRRHENHMPSLEDEEGQPIPGRYNRTSFIVQECMIAASIAIGQYFATNNIPALYKRHDIPADTQLETGKVDLPRALMYRLARADYTEIPGSRHLGLYATNVARFTSPLRRIEDYVNHSNFAAHLDSREFPYSQETLEKLAARLNRAPAATSIYIGPRAIDRRGKLTPFELLQQKIHNNTATPSDYSDVFFAELAGEEEDVLSLRQDAFALLITHKGVARSTIQIAIQRGQANVTQIDGRSFLVLHDGTRLPYKSQDKHSRSDRRVIRDSLATLSHRAGTPMRPWKISRMLERAAILQNGQSYIERLSIKLRTPVNISIVEQGEEGALCTISMKLAGEIKTSSATATSPVKAKLLAIASFITENDLFDNPPERPVSVRKASDGVVGELRAKAEKNNRIHPVVMVKAYVDKRKLVATYEYEPSEDEAGNPQRTCTVRITDEGGSVLHEASAYARNNDDAKLLAAARLSETLDLKPAFGDKRSKN